MAWCSVKKTQGQLYLTFTSTKNDVQKSHSTRNFRYQPRKKTSEKTLQTLTRDWSLDF